MKGRMRDEKQNPEEKKICESGFRLIILDSGF
jgi:hypothetical protein